jgi:hypothetical protein
MDRKSAAANYSSLATPPLKISTFSIRHQPRRCRRQQRHPYLRDRDSKLRHGLRATPAMSFLEGLKVGTCRMTRIGHHLLQPPRPSKSMVVKEKKKKKKVVADPASTSITADASAVPVPAPTGTGKTEKAQVSVPAGATADASDERWTRVEARKKKAAVSPQDGLSRLTDATTSDAGITTSVTGNSSPVTERTTEDELPSGLDECVF